MSFEDSIIAMFATILAVSVASMIISVAYFSVVMVLGVLSFWADDRKNAKAVEASRETS